MGEQIVIFDRRAKEAKRSGPLELDSSERENETSEKGFTHEQKKRRYTPEFKAQVVLEVLSQQKSLAQASREYGVRDSVISHWKQEFIERSPQLFQRSPERDERSQRIAELERMVGRLTMELEVSKKVSGILGS